jgi:hypothetical protein
MHGGRRGGKAGASRPDALGRQDQQEQGDKHAGQAVGKQVTSVFVGGGWRVPSACGACGVSRRRWEQVRRGGMEEETPEPRAQAAVTARGKRRGLSPGSRGVSVSVRTQTRPDTERGCGDAGAARP